MSFLGILPELSSSVFLSTKWSMWAEQVCGSEKSLLFWMIHFICIADLFMQMKSEENALVFQANRDLRHTVMHL